MTTATVSIMSASPAELEAELAIAVGEAEPTEVRVNGMRLTALLADQALNTRLWCMAGTENTWTIVGYAHRQWEVLDIYACLERGESVNPDGMPEIMIAPAAGAWLVTEADPSGESEMRLHIEPNGIGMWPSRDAALSAAQRLTGRRAHAARV